MMSLSGKGKPALCPPLGIHLLSTRVFPWPCLALTSHSDPLGRCQLNLVLPVTPLYYPLLDTDLARLHPALAFHWEAATALGALFLGATSLHCGPRRGHRTLSWSTSLFPE